MASEREDSPLELDPRTAALLAEFVQEKAEHQRRFDELDRDAEAAASHRITTTSFRELFSEDWQLSQFWYSDDFAEHFAHVLESALRPGGRPRIAFLCCPTAFVGFLQHSTIDSEAILLEHDDRFEKLNIEGRARYVPYDLHRPDVLPADLTDDKVDFAIADPPFLNETTNRDIATTLRRILKPDGRFILLTSTSVSEVLGSIYNSPPIGPLKRAESLTVEHAGGIQNHFGAWTSWDAGQDFGRHA